MSDVSIVVNTITPADVQAKIAVVLKILDLAKVIDNPQVTAVVNLIHLVVEKPVTAKLIADLLEAWNTNWKQDVAQFVAEFNKK